MIKPSSSGVDEIMTFGTRLYENVCDVRASRDYLMIPELPTSICIGGENVLIQIREPLAGLVGTVKCNEEAQTYSLLAAVSAANAQSEFSFLTLGSTPGYTSAWHHENISDEYTYFDSHARDSRGLLSPSGKAVMLSISSTPYFIEYVVSLAKSLSSSNYQQTPYEVTPVVINR